MLERQHAILALVSAASGGVAALVVSALVSAPSQSTENQLEAPAPSGSVGNGSASDQVAVEPLDAVVARLAEKLEQETAQRETLEQSIQELRAEIASMRPEQRVTATRVTPEERSARNQQSRTDRLIEFGFTEYEQERFRRMQAELQFEALELDDRARREGWFGTERYQNELNGLARNTNPLRSELGDKRYDEYLYASGQSNRLVISNVIPYSPAESSGLLPGDVILSYDGRPVLSNADLRDVRSVGAAGEAVDVEVYRDGDPVLLNIPRGPMGISIIGANINPRTNTIDFGG
ncbi:MAG: PDZ domain-containing protein [Pseudomonadota bacterium]